MQLSIDKSDLLDFIVQQLNNFFPDNNEVKKDELKRHFDLILQRTEYCFSKVNNKYFCNESNVLFNHLNADQYAMFLYFATNTIYKANSDLTLCTKIFQLNRYLHGIDIFYEVELPDIFLLVHPLGTVLGRGNYSNYLLVYQRCNVGSNKDIYPTLKEYVSLHPGASILGNCLVEENCKIGTGSLLLDKNLEQNSIYIGNPRDYIIRKSDTRASAWK